MEDEFAPYQKFRDEFKAEHPSWMFTPFRLGIQVGESGAIMTGPYPSGTRGHSCYAAGWEEGRRRRLEGAPILIAGTAAL